MLTGVNLGEERPEVGLSTRRSSVKTKAARWSLFWPEVGLRLLGEASSGLVAVCKSYGRE